MLTSRDQCLTTRRPRVASIAGAIVAIVGALSLLGHATGVPWLVRPVPVGPYMVPLTAAAFVLSGTSLWLLAPRRTTAGRRRAGRAMALPLPLIGAFVFGEYRTHRNFGIDLLLFRDQVLAWWPGGEGAGRPAEHAAVMFMVTGLTLALLDTETRHGRRPARVLCPATALATGVAVFGSLYNLKYVTSASTGLALSANIALVVMAVGILAARPELPPTSLFAGRSPGALVARRMALIAIVALAAGVALIIVGGRHLAMEEASITAATLFLIPTLYVVLQRTGAALNTAERRQRDLVNALRGERDFSRTVLDSLREGVITIDITGAIVQVNPCWSAITGIPAEEALGQTMPYPWWPREKIGMLTDRVRRALAGEAVPDIDAVLRRVDGAQLNVLIRFSPVRGPDGEPRMLVVSYRDITESRRAEADRRRAAEQLDTFFRLANDLLCIGGTDGYFKRLNPAWERTLGYPLEELLSKPFVEFIHPDDVAATREVRRSVGADRPFVNRYRCRDGSYRWLSWTSVLQGDLMYGSARDITAERQAEQAVARLAAIVDSTDDAVVGANLDGTITSWNPAAQRIYGYPAAEVIGRHFRMIVPPEHADEAAGILARVSRGEPVVRHRTLRLRKDGTRVHVELTISPIRDTAGNVVAVASIARDVTDRVKAEQRFQQMVRAAPDAMVIIAEDGTIVLVNEQTERLFGYPGDELVSQPIEMLVPRGSRERHVQYRKEYFTAPRSMMMGSGMDLQARRRDGSTFPVEINIAPLDTDQGILVSASVRDVSQRKQFEMALANARDKALAAAELKSKFVATVSHEIRTPMNGVIGLTDLLLNGPLQPTQRRYAEAIRTSGRALLEIINDILDFSKMEAGKIELVTAEFQLGSLLEEVIQVSAEAGRQKDLDVLCSYPPALATTVRGDGGRLRQVLLNLVGNAVKFTERGEVVLRAEPAPSADDHRPQVTFSVTDTGIGIAAGALANLFEPFSQVETGTERPVGGTGLGLAICRQFIELMGGQLDVESQPGRGSRFFFTLPFTVSAHRPPRHKPSPDHLRGRRILVADGNRTRRELFTEHLRAWGMTVSTVPDGPAAMSTLRQAAADHLPYEVASVDQHLPGDDGAELVRRIRADGTIPALRVLLLASGSCLEDEAAGAAGSVSVLAKPVGPGHLYGCLLELLSPDKAAGPVQRDAAQAGDGQPTSRTGEEGGLILVAEDNEVNQMVAVETLSMLGYHTDVARDGAEAVELAAARPYRAILMDCQMPKMDGYAAAAEVRHRERPNQHVPIIAMTAGAFAEDRQRCLAAGMDDYLTKPIDIDELRGVLARWTAASDT